MAGLTPMAMADIILDELHDRSLGTRVYNWINLAQEDMDSRCYWHNLESSVPSMIQFKAPYSTGTVAVTNGSPTVTGTGTAWTSAEHVGQTISLPDSAGNTNTYYYITAVDAGAQTLTLGMNYIGANASGSSYNIDYITYALPSDVSTQKIRTVLIQNPHRELKKVDVKERNELFPNLLSGRSQPRAWMDWGPYMIQPWPAPEANYICVIRYQKRPAEVTADTAAFDWPVQMHRTLLKGAIAQGWKWKDDNQAPEIYQEFNRMLQEAVEENNRRGGDKPTTRPFDEQTYTDRFALIYGRRIMG